MVSKTCASSISFFILLLVVTTSLKAQETILRRNPSRITLSGRITEAKTGLPLHSATIYIADLKAGAASDTNGNYRIRNLPAGNFLVEVGFVGYKKVLKNISFTKDIEVDFSLDISITEENEVVVTGSSKATSLRRNPIPIVSINKQYLQQNLSTNIIDAIARVPGINAVTTGPNVSKPFIRGLGFNRILTLNDGVRQEGQQWGDEHGIEIDQNAVEKIEVVKGPASLIYGSDAIAGVINLLPPNPPAPGMIRGNISNEYQTNNRLISNSVFLAGNNKGLVWMGRFSHKLATNYKNKYDGRVYNTGFNEIDFTGLLGLNRAWGYSHLGFSAYSNRQEVPDGSRDSATRKFTKQITEADTLRPIVSDKELSSYRISNLYQHVQHYRIYTANSFALGSGRAALNLSYQKSIRREFSHPQFNIPGLQLSLNTFSYDAKYNVAEKNGWGVTGGVNGMYQNNNADKGTEFVIPSYQQFDVGPFIFVKKSIDNLELAGGLRYDVRNFSNEALYTKPDAITGFDKPVYGQDTVGADRPFYTYKNTFSGISGSIGLSYRFSSQLSMKFNIGRGFRAPNISEISANGVHPGTNIYQLGNLNFKPEFNLQEDIGITYNTHHFTLNAEVFNNNINNYIFNHKLLNSRGEDSVIVAGNQTFQYQSAKAQLYGGEFTVDLHPHPLDWLHFENSLSVVYGKNRGGSNNVKINDSSQYLPFIAPLHTFSELRANVKKVSSAISNGFAKIQMEYYATQNRVLLEADTETPTKGYHLVNAGFGGDLTNRNGNTIFTIALLANNIFDNTYQSHLNRLKYFEPYPGNYTGRNGIFNMGRNFSVKINIPLELKKQ